MAMDFERSSSQWVDQGSDVPATNGLSEASLAAWVKLESAAGTMGVISIAIGPPPGSSATSRFTMEIRSTRRVQVVVRAADGGSSNTLLSATALTLGVWTHIVVVVDIANDVFEIYIDGVLDASSSPSFTPTAWPSTNSKNAALGSKPDGSAEFLDGVLDDARIYSVRLTAAEAQTLHAGRGKATVLRGLEQWYLLSEKEPGATASGAGTVKDGAVRQENATPNASPVYAESELSPRRRVG